MSKKLTVGIIFGGRSGEHEISIISARSVMEATDKSIYNIKSIYIDKKGNWTIENKLVEASNALKDVDIAFPVLHGPYGEDGTIQGLFEMEDVPYVGAGVASSAVAMDKQLSKDIFRSHEFHVADYIIIQKHEWDRSRQKIIRGIEQIIGYPNFVKPANLGSSVGISKVMGRNEIEEAIEQAFLYDSKGLVEEAVKDAREIEVSVLGNEVPQASVCGEIIPSRDFYSYEAKYVDDKSELIIPAKLSVETSNKIRETAIAAYKAVGISGMARIDFLVQKDNKIFLSEVNTIPGFTKISMYPKLWEATGLPYPKLIDKLIKLGLERYNSRRHLKADFPSKIII